MRYLASSLETSPTPAVGSQASEVGAPTTPSLSRYLSTVKSSAAAAASCGRVALPSRVGPPAKDGPPALGAPAAPALVPPLPALTSTPVLPALAGAVPPWFGAPAAAPEPALLGESSFMPVAPPPPQAGVARHRTVHALT